MRMRNETGHPAIGLAMTGLFQPSCMIPWHRVTRAIDTARLAQSTSPGCGTRTLARFLALGNQVSWSRLKLHQSRVEYLGFVTRSVRFVSTQLFVDEDMFELPLSL